MSQRGRDGQPISDREDSMTSDQGNTARRAPGTGLPGGNAGVDTESVDFDATGDLDRGANDAADTEPSTGPGPEYGQMNAGLDPIPGAEDDTSTSARFHQDTGSGQGPGSAMRVTTMPGGMGSGVGDDDGSGPGMDTDPGSIRGGSLSTGTPQRAGLGGPSSGREMDQYATGDASFANPADMGDQG